MRIVPFLSWTALLVGAAGIAAGKAFDVPKGLHFGVFVIGAGFLLGGLESLFTRRMSFRYSGDAGESYAGAPAVVWGLMALVIGSACVAAAYLMQSGDWRPALDRLARHPGPAFLAIGLLVAGAGGLVIMRPDAGGGLWHTLFVRYPRMLVGLTIVCTGLFAAGIGTWEWVYPREFDRHVRSPEGVYVRAVCETWKEVTRGNVRTRPR